MIFTFYSYKGGVGRTHLLANMAAYLCHYKKRRILLIDWDLEAPGLHFYFDKENEDIKSKGLIDLLNKHLETFKNTEQETLSEDDFFNPLDAQTSQEHYIQNLITNEKGGKIDLMPAIAYKEGFHTAIEDFDWIKNYEQFYLGSYLLWLKEKLKAHYDYVLIDSRTGFNDYSGICNVLMPDMNIILVAPNAQNFSGAEQMAMRILNSSFTQSEAREPFILPILSRLDNDHEDADQWRARFAETFAFVIPKLDKDLRAFGKEILQILSAQTTLLYNRRFAIGEKIQFKPTAEPIIDGSPLEVFQNIALNFLEQMNSTGEIDVNKMVGNKMIPVYLRKIEENPEDYEAYFGLGLAYQELENYKEAEKYYQKAIDIKPNLYEAWYNLGIVYDDLQAYEKAIEAYQKAIDIKPDYDWAWNNLGLVYSAFAQFGKGLKEYEKAIEAFQKAIDIKPDKHEAWYNLGNVYNSLQAYEKAIEAYQNAIDIKPDKHEAWHNLGIVYYNLQAYEKAIEAYQKAIDIKPDKHEAWNNLGLAHSNLQHYKKAINAYNKAISYKVDHHEAWNNLGIIYYKLKKYEEAIEYYEKAIAYNLDYYWAWNNLGAVYFQLENYDKAINSYHKALEIKDDFEEALNNLGNAYVKLKNYDKAISYYKKATEAKSNFYMAWNGIGTVYIHQKEYTKAKEIFEKIIKEDPSYKNAYFNLACTYSLEKNKAQALAYLQKAIALEPINKQKAQEDPDFEWLWSDADFLALVA
ncbi:MAG: tetratricopeptide repeat protein [Bernardetiaceae bacterium]|nr:tetratricopeptide repeat protein [Bernardetiaceae bacterium]